MNLITIVLISLSAVLGVILLSTLIYFIFLGKKDTTLLKSVKNIFTKSKVSAFLVITIYAFSFGINSAVDMSLTKTEKAYNSLAINQSGAHIFADINAPALTVEDFTDREDEVSFYQYVTRSTVVPKARIVNSNNVEILGWDYEDLYVDLLSTPAGLNFWENSAEASYGNISRYISFTKFHYDFGKFASSSEINDYSYSMESYFLVNSPAGVNTDEVFAVTTIGDKNVEDGTFYETEEDWQSSLSISEDEQTSGYKNNPFYFSTQEQNTTVDEYDILQDDALDKLFSLSPTADGSTENPYPILIIEDYFRYNNYKIGDTINPQGVEDNFEIVGTYYNPRYVYPFVDPTKGSVDNSTQTILLTSSRVYESLAKDTTIIGVTQIQYWYLSIGVNDLYDKVSDFKQILIDGKYYNELDAVLNKINGNGDDGINTSLNFVHQTYGNLIPAGRNNYVNNIIGIYSSVSLVLTLIFVITTGMVLSLIMSKRVKDFSKQIGVMKAMGQNKSNVMISWLLIPILIATMGFALSFVLAIPLGLLFTSVLSGSFFALNAFAFSAFSWYIIGVSLVIPLLAMISITLLVVWLTLRKPTVELLTNKSKDKVGIIGQEVGKALPEKTNFTLGYQIKGLFKSSSKSLFLVASVFMGTFIAAFAFSGSSMGNTIEKDINNFANFESQATWVNTNAFTDVVYESDAPSQDEEYTLGFEENSGTPWWTDDLSAVDTTVEAKEILDKLIWQMQSYVYDTTNELVTKNLTTNELIYSYIPKDSYLTFARYINKVTEVYQADSDPTNDNFLLTTLLYIEESPYGDGATYPMPTNPYVLEHIYLLLSPLNNTSGEKAFTMGFGDLPTIFNEVDSLPLEEWMTKYYNSIFSNQSINQIYVNNDSAENGGNEEIRVNDLTAKYSRGNYNWNFKVSSFENETDLQNTINLIDTQYETLVNYEQTENEIPLIVSKVTLDILNANLNMSYDVNSVIEFDMDKIKLFDPTYDFSKTEETVKLNYKIIAIWDLTYEYSVTLDKFIINQLDEITSATGTFPNYTYEFVRDTTLRLAETNDYLEWATPLIISENEMLNYLSSTVPTEQLTIENLVANGIPTEPFYITKASIAQQNLKFYSTIEYVLTVTAIANSIIVAMLLILSMNEIIDDTKKEVSTLKAFGYSNAKSTTLVISPYFLIIAGIYVASVFATIFLLSIITTILTGVAGVSLIFLLATSQILLLSMAIVLVMAVTAIVALQVIKKENPLKEINESND